MNELAGQSLGGYQLEEEIGRGSMGMVYRGKQIALGREVAVKVLSRALAKDASYVARFIREAQIIAGLNHPHIVQIYDAGQQNGLLYFVMEFVQGPTIANLLHLDGTISLHFATEYAAQIAEALDAAYGERNVIHRDIKPENLMLDRWGKVKVMDFGLARATGLQRITIAKTLVGSIYYASPEQVWGHQLDNRSDIYALGVVLYEMVTGQRPFVGRSLPELTQAIISGPLKPPTFYNPEIPAELEHIILTAMSRDRQQRYEQAILMTQALRSLNLKPTMPQIPTSVQSISPTLPHRQQTARERIAIQPPKRPQMPPPRYIELEQTQPPPPEPVAQSPVTAYSPPTANPPVQVGAASPHEVDTEGPTGPLGVANMLSSPEQKGQVLLTEAKRRRFWQKLFKPTSR
ncbi:MAG TPA: serine/threonine-protein kinase [Ktedonobacteraceae bacterium]|nr:serine/threonine-protein kinase [Ktedonobacteraceae bacterium]